MDSFWAFLPKLRLTNQIASIVHNFFRENITFFMFKNLWFWFEVHVYISFITKCEDSTTHMGISVCKMLCRGFVLAHTERISMQKRNEQFSPALKKQQLFHKMSNFHDPLSIWSVTMKSRKCTLQDTSLPPLSFPKKENWKNDLLLFLVIFLKIGSVFRGGP